MAILQSLRQQLNLLPVRITLLFTMIFVGIALYTNNIFYNFLRSDLLTIQERHALQLLEMATTDATPSLSSHTVDRQALATYAAQLFAELPGNEVAVYDPTGQLVAAVSRTAWPAQLPERSIHDLATAQFTEVGLLANATQEQPTFYTTIIHQGQPLGWQAIRLNLHGEDSIYARFLTRFSSGMFVTLALILASGVYLRSYTRRNLQPLLNLTNRIAQTNWDAELSTQLNGEFRQLGDSIGDMKASLARYEQQRMTLLDRISHDILSPLKTIAMIADLYQGQKGETLEENDWNVVYICAEHVTRLLEDLKYLMSRRIDYLPPPPEYSIDITVAIEQMLAYYQAKTQGRNIHFTFTPVAAQPYCVPIERTRLMQVLGNLLDNALSHGKATTLEIRLAQVEQVIALEVKDNGIGIDEKLLPHIFAERFSTGQQSGSHQGLGLAIIHDIVRAHRGTIEVQSKPGAGTTFAIHLPAGICPEPAKLAGWESNKVTA